MKQILKFNPFLGFAIVLLISGSLYTYAVRTYRARDIASQSVREQNEIIIHIDRVLLCMLDMETGLRGYMLTGSNVLLDHYYLGKSQFENTIRELLEFPAETEAHQRWLEVQALEEDWVNNWAEKGIQIRREVIEGRVSNDALVNHLIAESEEQAMDAIRAKLSEGIHQEYLLLNLRIVEEHTANRRVYGVMTMGIGFSATLGLASILLLIWANRIKAKQIELQHLLIDNRERERAEIARNLHDGPVQDLLLTSFSLDEISKGLDPTSIERLEEVKRSIQSILADLRIYAIRLRSPILSKFGLVKAIQSHLDTFEHVHPGMLIRLEATPEDPPLPEGVRETLYRIYQEAMNNIARHARASQVIIHFQATDKQAVLQIQDNGVGFTIPDDPLSLARQGHLGLVGMRERAESAGGTLDVISKPGEGSSLRVMIPLPQSRNIPSPSPK